MLQETYDDLQLVKDDAMDRSSDDDIKKALAMGNQIINKPLTQEQLDIIAITILLGR
jgi:hypothetical protein